MLGPESGADFLPNKPDPSIYHQLKSNHASVVLADLKALPESPLVIQCLVIFEKRAADRLVRLAWRAPVRDPEIHWMISYSVIILMQSTLGHAKNNDRLKNEPLLTKKKRERERERKIQ